MTETETTGDLSYLVPEIDFTGNPLLTEALARQLVRRTQHLQALPGFLVAARGLDARVRVPIEDSAQLEAACRVIPGFNRFNPTWVANAFGPLVERCMKVEIENWIGGPAFYFTLPYCTNQMLAAGAFLLSSGDKIDRTERIGLYQHMIREARRLNANEITVTQNRQDRDAEPEDREYHVGRTGNRPYELRIWWD